MKQSRKRRARHVLTLRLALRDTKPEVWRRVLVRSDLTLHALHRIFQILMQWYDYHLYMFTVGERRFEDGRIEEAEGEDARTVTLGSLALERGDSFSYEYDFGDSWEHDVVVEKIGRWRESMWLPWVEGGANAAPPEDAGGFSGFQELKEALADPDHTEHASYREWAGKDYDPYHFDVRAAQNAVMLAWAWEALDT
jgi:hypothetical protein